MQQTNHLYMTFLLLKKIPLIFQPSRCKNGPHFSVFSLKIFNQADVKMVQGLPEKNNNINASFIFYIKSSFINFRLFTT